MKKTILLLFVLFNFGNSFASEKILPIIEGKNNSEIKMIIYESMTCSHCANFHRDIYPKLKNDFLDTGVASIEFRNFPLDLAALNASKIAHCKNDGLSKILHFLYLNQDSWVKGNNIIEINNNLKNLLKNKGFDLNFEKCIKNQKLEDFILEERIEGFKEYDIQATPTLIINGKKFNKDLNYNNLKKIIKKML